MDTDLSPHLSQHYLVTVMDMASPQPNLHLPTTATEMGPNHQHNRHRLMTVMDIALRRQSSRHLPTTATVLGLKAQWN